MKHKMTVCFSFILTVIFSAVCLLGCEMPYASAKASIVDSTENAIVIRIDETYQGEEAYLDDALFYLQGQNQLRYEIRSGMIQSMNGKENNVAENCYWLIYASNGDEDFVNREYPYEYDGQIYYACMLGAEGMPIKIGERYLFVYQKTS